MRRTRISPGIHVNGGDLPFPGREHVAQLCSKEVPASMGVERLPLFSRFSRTNSTQVMRATMV